MNLLKQIWQSSSLRKKILFTIAVLFIYRVFAQISVPGVDVGAVREFFSDGGGALGIYSILTGGSMERFSIVMMGLGPYINASIIMQLAAVVIPKIEMLKKEGQSGEKKIAQYTRMLTVIFAMAMSYGMMSYLGNSIPGFANMTFVDKLPLMVTMTAGTLFLMWLGEIISERGLGNGISLLIMASLVSNIPSVLAGILGSVSDLGNDTGKLIPGILFFAVTFILIVATVLATEGHRKIPVNYGTGGNAMSSSLPIRVLQAGMIPIIFALSLITFPSVMIGFVKDPGTVLQFISTHFNPAEGGAIFYVTYFLLIVFFSYFYVSITFKPEDVAENIQKRGGFVPGYRPGSETVNHLSEVSFRLNLWGGSFLAIVAIIPMLFTFFSDTMTQQDLIISGSGIIIIVGVVLDLIRKINDQLVMQDYDKLK